MAHLTRSLIIFGKDKYDYQFTNETAEESLLGFFRESNLGFLSAAEDQNALPNLGGNRSERFIVAKFIQDAKEASPDTFNFLVDVAVGVALANTIVYGENLTKISGNFRGLNLYFDTGYILILLGTSGEEKRQAFAELTQDLLTAGAKLFVFEHTYDEIMRLLNSALYWMHQGNYDSQKASRTLRFFLSNDFSASDVEIFIAQISQTFNRYKIQKAPKPDYAQDIRYQISEPQLRDLIVLTGFVE